MTDDKGQAAAERDARNKGLERGEKDLHRRGPKSESDQKAPAPERPVTPQEEADEDIANLENPPQAEGPRERSNDAV